MRDLVGGFTFDHSFDRFHESFRNMRQPPVSAIQPPPAPTTAPQEMIALPHLLPHTFGTFGAALGLAPAAPHMASESLPPQLAMLLSYTLGYLRQEVDVPYALHCAVPSARSIFPIRLCLWLPPIGERSAGLYQYHPHYHALEPIAPATAALQVADALGTGWQQSQLTCFAVADFQLPAQIYNEFSLRLCTLEAGHVAENLGLLGQAMGWQVRYQGFYNDQALAKALGLRTPSEAVLAVVTFGPTSVPASVDPPGDETRSAPALAMTPLPLHPSLGRIPLLQSLAESVERPLPSTPLSPSSLLPPGLRLPLPAAEGAEAGDLRLLLRTRNAGREYRGLTGRAKPVSQQVLCAVLHVLEAPAIPSDFDDSIPTPYLMVAPIQVEGLPVGLYRYVPQHRELIEVYTAPDAAKRLGRELIGNGVTPGALAFRLYLVAPWAAAMQGAAARGYRLLQLRAGALAQRLSLAAAGQGLFCRPFLHFDHLSAEQMMGLTSSDDIVLYQMLIGRNRYQGWIHDLSL